MYFFKNFLCNSELHDNLRESYRKEKDILWMPHISLPQSKKPKMQKITKTELWDMLVAVKSELGKGLPRAPSKRKATKVMIESWLLASEQRFPGTICTLLVKKKPKTRKPIAVGSPGAGEEEKQETVKTCLHRVMVCV